MAGRSISKIRPATDFRDAARVPLFAEEGLFTAERETVLAGSTIKTLHRIAGEERHPEWRLWTWALMAQSAIDPSLWVRRVDVALIGGDPLTLARRITQLLRGAAPGPGPRIAVLHPGLFSGAPLAALEDPDLRREMDLTLPDGVGDEAAARYLLTREIGRATAALALHGRGGVVAVEAAQGAWDPIRQEMVLRLTRRKGVGRRRGVVASAAPAAQMTAASDPRGQDLFSRSMRLHREGLSQLHQALLAHFDEPPVGRRFADVVVAPRCEILSGFISPPAVFPTGDPAPAPLSDQKDHVCSYRLAGPPPRLVRDALESWRDDFRRATHDPILTP